MALLPCLLERSAVCSKWGGEWVKFNSVRCSHFLLKKEKKSDSCCCGRCPALWCGWFFVFVSFWWNQKWSCSELLQRYIFTEHCKNRQVLCRGSWSSCEQNCFNVWGAAKSHINSDSSLHIKRTIDLFLQFCFCCFLNVFLNQKTEKPLDY